MNHSDDNDIQNPPDSTPATEGDATKTPPEKLGLSVSSTSTPNDFEENSSGTVESTEGQSDSGRGDRSRDGQAREGQNRDNKNRDRNNDNDDRRAPRAPRTESAKDLLMVELPERSRHANARLRANLSGTIMVRLDDKPARYVVDWTGDQMTVVEAAAGTVDLKTIDCEIRISEKNLMKVVNGDLNPQIGMLSDKISVDGRLSLSVYLFNLLTPSAHY